jgi:hypothetical protein
MPDSRNSGSIAVITMNVLANVAYVLHHECRRKVSPPDDLVLDLVSHTILLYKPAHAKAIVT